MHFRALALLLVASGCSRTDEAILDLRGQALMRCPISLVEVGLFATTSPLEPGIAAPLTDTLDSGLLDGAEMDLALNWVTVPQDRVTITVEPENVPDLQARFEGVDWDEAAGVTLDDFLAQDPAFPGCNGTGWLGEASVDVSVGPHMENHTGTLILLEGRGTVFGAPGLDLELVGPNASGDVFAMSAEGTTWSWTTLEL
jgi:hypothetical protein